MTSGGPGIASEVPAKYVIDHLFERSNLGQAIAASTIDAAHGRGRHRAVGLYWQSRAWREVIGMTAAALASGPSGAAAAPA